MTRDEFHHQVISLQKQNDDSFLNSMVQVASENNIDIEAIAEYVTPKLVELLREESVKVKLVKEEPAKAYDLF